MQIYPTKYFIIAGFFGAFFLSVAELLFHFVPLNIAQENLVHQGFITLVSSQRIGFGYLLILLFSPLYFLGYYGVFRWLQERTGKNAHLFIYTAYWMLILGVIWLGARPLWQAVLLSGGDHVQILGWYEGTLTMMRGLLFVSSFIFVWQLRKTSYFREFFFWNPFVLWALIFVGFFLASNLFWPLLVIAFNASHVIFFAYFLINRNKLCLA